MAPTVPVERARRRIQALVADVRDDGEFRSAVLLELRDLVPWDGAVLTPFDPATTLPTAGTGLGVDLADCRTALELEYRHPDVGSWSELASGADGTAVLSDRLRGDLMGSTRYRELYRGQGWRDELRAVFRVGGACWGGATLLRARRDAFTAAETAALAAVQDAIARGLRTSALRGLATVRERDGSSGPAVVTVDSAGRVESRTAAAVALLAGTEDAQDGETGLIAAVQSVAARQRASADGTAQVRLRARDGSWLVLHAGALEAPDGLQRTVVTVEAARPSDVVALAGAAIGLTTRETEVLEHLVAGRSSVEIGRRLYVSPHTVNDHVRHIFEKAGVRSRMELSAWLFFSQYAPRLARKDGEGRP